MTPTRKDSPEKKLPAKKTTAKPAAPAKAPSRAKIPAKVLPKASKQPIPSGFTQTASGIVVPDSAQAVIPASKFKKGLDSAKGAIRESISEFAEFMTQDMEVSEIELSVSFSAEGKFLGFGVGGATTVKITIRPSHVKD